MISMPNAVRSFVSAHTSWIVVAVLVTACMVLGVLTTYVVIHVTRSADTVMLAAINACGTTANATACTRRIIQKSLQADTPEHLMRMLAQQLPPAQCHFVGHVVGQQTYIRDRDLETALAECPPTCDSACVHGAIGEVFAEKLGLGTPDDKTDVDLSHLSPNELRTVGTQLCTSQEACHGVGHATFQSTLDMHKAMDLCSDVTLPDSSACYNGVAMEYSDILWSRNMREVDGIVHPDLKGIGTLCLNFSTFAQMRSCFHYFSRIVVAEMTRQSHTEDEGIARVRKICEAYRSTKLQALCFEGYGAYRTYLVLTDQDAALNVCGDVQSDRNKAACYYGQVSAGVENRQQLLIGYCGKLPNEAFQYSCYQTVFSFLYKLEVSTENARAACGDEKSCLQGYADRAQSPWEMMEKTFAQ